MERIFLENDSEKKQYKKKTYNFVSDIWSLFVRVIDQDEQIDGLDLDLETSDIYEETDDEV